MRGDTDKVVHQFFGLTENGGIDPLNNKSIGISFHLVGIIDMTGSVGDTGNKFSCTGKTAAHSIEIMSHFLFLPYSFGMIMTDLCLNIAHKSRKVNGKIHLLNGF